MSREDRERKVQRTDAAPDAPRNMTELVALTGRTIERDGRPDVTELALWPTCCANQDQWMVFGVNDGIRCGVLSDKLDVLTELYRKRWATAH